MELEKKWVEYDFNPFLLFDKDGKIKYVNTEAQFLLGSASSKELFELASSYAPLSYGFKTTFLDLEYGRFKFFGITVGYEDDDEIGIMLYRFPILNNQVPKKPKGEIVNIYTVIDLCISSNSIGNNIKFTKEFDPTIPDILTDSNMLVKILNNIYKCFLENDHIHTKVYFIIGEYIRYDDKKYPLFSIKISSKKINKEHTKELKTLIKDSCFYIDITQNSISINIPIITS